MQFGIRSLLLLTLVASISVAGVNYLNSVARWDRIRSAIDPTAPVKSLPLAPNGQNYRDYYKGVFQLSNDDELSRLTRGKDKSLAIQAAWEKVRRTVPVEKGESRYRPDPKVINEFLIVLESKCQVEIPGWWRDIVSDCQTWERDSIFFSSKTKHVHFHRRLDSIACPIDASVKKVDDDLVYRSGKHQIPIPNGLLDNSRDKWWGNYSICFDDQNTYVAKPDEYGYEHNVVCLDRNSGTLKWHVLGYGHAGLEIAPSGPGPGVEDFHYSIIPLDNNRVAIFGSSWFGFYFQVFDSDDGTTLAHFSSNY